MSMFPKISWWYNERNIVNEENCACGRVNGLIRSKSLKQVVKHSFIELCLPWMNLGEILSQGTPQPKWATIREELRLWER